MPSEEIIWHIDHCSKIISFLTLIIIYRLTLITINIITINIKKLKKMTTHTICCLLKLLNLGRILRRSKNLWTL